jgi:hypothetical protein
MHSGASFDRWYSIIETLETVVSVTGNHTGRLPVVYLYNLYHTSYSWEEKQTAYSVHTYRYDVLQPPPILPCRRTLSNQ